MDIGKAGQWTIIMAFPALAFGAAVHLPRAVRALYRMAQERAERQQPRPGGPPIEQLAADLRRLLHQHDAVRRSPDVVMRAHRLWALEGALADAGLVLPSGVGLLGADRH